MYHVPTHDTWDAESIVQSLRQRDIDAYSLDDTVRIPLPPAQPLTMIGKFFTRLFQPRPLCITISFCPEKFIRNIDLEYDPMKMPLDFPCFDDIRDAMHERGYLIEDDRAIAARYCPDSDELAKLFDRIEQLQIQKEEFAAKQDFENAVVVRDEEEMIRKEIDAMLFVMVGRSTNTEKRDEP